LSLFFFPLSSLVFFSSFSSILEYSFIYSIVQSIDTYDHLFHAVLDARETVRTGTRLIPIFIRARF
jgi:hypothetical protein